MSVAQAVLVQMREIVALGGPVIAVLMLLSVVVVAAALFKLWDFAVLGVGRHGRIDPALRVLAQDHPAQARALLARSRHHLAPVFAAALAAPPGDAAALKARITAEAEIRLARMESGFRLLDAIGQIAPLLGLFGTVLGMIDAFRALQEAGTTVDPAVLAGGIWVALLTTAAGLAVAMPAVLILSWFETRAARERLWADRVLATIFCPMDPDADADRPAQAGAASPRMAHGH
ncbi:MotA/TolQ/ExbB proton channel family protein [Meridianimarinicoccus sp. RP-17]|uniref:MotA/TolQ/ExbB proton channel family protein n=1 Tax=Meridianimarinicoccus zhengii TaxID=2056810 RepID=UPI000DABB448|nr:MotA/TolQ/ExbB proton channel family protein [Phycocomes zhengii]